MFVNASSLSMSPPEQLSEETDKELQMGHNTVNGESDGLPTGPFRDAMVVKHVKQQNGMQILFENQLA